ncbi:hypothetical protein [Streptomyces fumanus]|uniref:hypothetical protein n=1 Tax=Streptomyces fumanus TaxID=67302 RepID=UPI0033FE7105
MRYLPLEQITLRRDAGHVVAESAGQRILPIDHANRVLLPPYDLRAELLLPAGHPACSASLQLSGLARALPDARHTPRVTAGHLTSAPPNGACALTSCGSQRTPTWPRPEP